MQKKNRFFKILKCTSTLIREIFFCSFRMYVQIYLKVYKSVVSFPFKKKFAKKTFWTDLVKQDTSLIRC